MYVWGNAVLLMLFSSIVLSFMLLLIYGVAIVILFLFIIMFLNVRIIEIMEEDLPYYYLNYISFFCLIGFIFNIVLNIYNQKILLFTINYIVPINSNLLGELGIFFLEVQYMYLILLILILMLTLLAVVMILREYLFVRIYSNICLLN